MGWVVAGGLALVALRLRLRLELVARAEHELRGPLTAFSLALDAARGTVAGRRLAVVLDAELARARAGLADLAAARRGRPPVDAGGPVPVGRLLGSSGGAHWCSSRWRSRAAGWRRRACSRGSARSMPPWVRSCRCS